MVWNLPSKSCCLAIEPQGSARLHLPELGLPGCATNILALLCEFWGITLHPLTCIPGLLGQALKFSSSGVVRTILSLQLLLNQTFTVLVSYWLQAWRFQASWDEEVRYIFPGAVTLARVEINYF